jgi:hypothetical protein
MNPIGSAFLLLIALAVLMMPAVAAASPPDALWIPGFYDADDGDDVVTFVNDSTAMPNGDASVPLPLQPLIHLASQHVFVQYTTSWLLPDERGPPRWSWAFNTSPR